MKSLAALNLCCFCHKRVCAKENSSCHVCLKALADAWRDQQLYGEGIVKLEPDGIKHVPFDEARHLNMDDIEELSEHGDQTSTI